MILNLGAVPMYTSLLPISGAGPGLLVLQVDSPAEPASNDSEEGDEEGEGNAGGEQHQRGQDATESPRHRQHPLRDRGGLAAPGQVLSSEVWEFCQWSTGRARSWDKRRGRGMGKAVLKPPDLVRATVRLQKVSTASLWAFMAQYYLPVQQLQAVGGGDATLRASAVELFEAILAGGATA
jgi:hypothetical protein